MTDYSKKDVVASYKFPIEGILDHPRMSIIVQSARSRYPMEILLPIPQGLPVQDGFSYGSTNLNQIGAVAQNVMKGLGSDASVGSVVSGTLQGLKNEISQQNTSTSMAALAQISNSAGGIGSSVKPIADAVMYNQRALLNPNQVTTFNGSNVRSYSFEFKLVATSKAETVMIKNIVERLRLNAYPKGQTVILSYPPEFKIHILDKDGKQNKYYAGIHNCYLMNISAAYNTITNSYYGDGAPLDVNLSLGFQETKALTQDDIIRLQEFVETGEGA